MEIYVVKDTKAQTYGMPFFQRNHVTATRAIANEVRRADPTNTIYTNPEDFELYAIGTFDTDTGRVTGLEQPQLIATALSLIPRE